MSLYLDINDYTLKYKTQDGDRELKPSSIETNPDRFTIVTNQGLKNFIYGYDPTLMETVFKSDDCANIFFGILSNCIGGDIYTELCDDNRNILYGALDIEDGCMWNVKVKREWRNNFFQDVSDVDKNRALDSLENIIKAILNSMLCTYYDLRGKMKIYFTLKYEDGSIVLKN